MGGGSGGGSGGGGGGGAAAGTRSDSPGTVVHGLLSSAPLPGRPPETAALRLSGEVNAMLQTRPARAAAAGEAEGVEAWRARGSGEGGNKTCETAGR